MKTSLFLTLMILCNIALFGQDILYTNNGQKILAKVIEINPESIIYKSFDNIDGPSYIIDKNTIVLIEYKNGTSQIINSDVNYYSSKEEKSLENEKHPDHHKPTDLYYINKNVVSINALGLMNGDVTILYDRDFLDGKLNLSFLGSYNFNDRMNFLNATLSLANNQRSKKLYDLGIGVNYMFETENKVHSFIGILVKHLAFSYDKSTVDANGIVTYQKTQANQIATMITNGLQYRMTPNFNLKLFYGFGIQSNDMQKNNGSFNNPFKMYFGYCFGYRFN